MSALQQLNVRFDAVEDRLVLNVNTDDGARYSLWMTRRFTRLLLKLLESATERAVEEVVARPSPPAEGEAAPTADSTREAVRSFQRESALAKVDFTTEYRPQAEHHPLGEAPRLASRIDYRSLDNGTLSLTLVVDDGQGVSLVIDRDLQFAVIKLLEEGAEKAEWDLAPPRPAEPRPATVSVGDKVVH